ncbi:DUF3102 domain-containing protein [Bradyrhizobium sp. CCBAU 53338]|uniref:DUF3102 domain-containing protein n=1 Tax=Bradyrhizobium sp. CCBAU 53338 TaxID=1325111 RepID=UPI001AEDBCF2|nr:DUF3102 domain-containing protein [Bradyrhizobium sp. CCBAU 53338]
MNDLTPRAFDYGDMPSVETTVLRAQAARIRKLNKSVMASIIEIGNDLIAAKQKLPHGSFARWIESECGFSDKTAQNYMGAARLAEGKTELISLLAPAVAYKLAAKSAPPPAVANVIDRLSRGERVSEIDVETEIINARTKQFVAAKKEATQKQRAASIKANRDWKAGQAAREEAARVRREKYEAAAKAISARLGSETVAWLLSTMKDAGQGDIWDSATTILSLLEEGGGH